MTDLDKSKTSPTPPLEPIFIYDKEKLFPSAVAASCGLDHHSMAILEIPNGSTSLYTALLEYAAQYAIDLHIDFSSLDTAASTVSTSPSSSTAGDAPSARNQVVKGHNGVPVPLREGPGILSSLWSCPDVRYDPFGLSDSDSDSETSPDEEDPAAPVVTEEEPEKEVDILEEFVTVGALKKKANPPLQRYQFGLGFGKIQLGDKLIYLHHWGYGLPVSENYAIQVFRTLVLAGDDPQMLKELCAVALKWRSDREQARNKAKPGRFTLYRFKTDGGGSGDWVNQGYKRARPVKSVILQEGQLEQIVKDIRDFVAKDTKAWYESHGLPHRRSFLFHGPPGCGKTSTIRVIAGMFKLNACFLSLTAHDFSNQVLQDALTNIPERALLVLEDVDVLFNEDRKSETSTSLTFSGMLNALDGLVSMDGIMTIFTTNHLEKLDSALIRGGRVDRRFEFVHPNQKQLAELFLSFYEDAPRELAERFAQSVFARPEEESRSIATLQQHFIYCRKMNAEECVAALATFFSEFYPKGGRSRNSLYI